MKKALSKLTESGTKEKIIYLLAKILPMITLLFEWSGIYGVKQYSGLAYIFYNKVSSILGLIILFGEMFLKTKPKYKMGLNLFGHFIFWGPLFYGAFTETKNIHNLTTAFYISLGLVIIGIMIQEKIRKTGSDMEIKF